MRAAIKAINEDNTEALTTAIEKLDDIDAGIFHWFIMFLSFYLKSLLYLAVEKGSMPLVKVLLEKHPDANKNIFTYIFLIQF